MRRRTVAVRPLSGMSILSRSACPGPGKAFFEVVALQTQTQNLGVARAPRFPTGRGVPRRVGHLQQTHHRWVGHIVVAYPLTSLGAARAKL